MREKEIKIGNISLTLSNEGGNVRVKSDKENVILSNQNIDIVAELLRHNINKVVEYYRLIITNTDEELNLNDLYVVSLSIALYYIYMYNSWRTMYKGQENKDLRFKEKDFSNPSTHDIIFNYYKNKYPDNWEEKCAALLEMELNELKAYYKTREDFYNK